MTNHNTPHPIAEAFPAPDATFCATRALCNVCGVLTDAKVVFRDRQVYLVKWCLEHGPTEALISSDQSYYLSSLGYIKPGTEPLSRAMTAFTGCPDSCGLCPQHQQHTCVPLLEITGRCDLCCPICLVDHADKPELSLAEVRAAVDNLLIRERRVNMLTLSGGEPTQHPDFLAVLDEVRRPEIGIVSVSTNGVALARDDGLIKALRDRDVVIALQYDGARPETYATLRRNPGLAELKAHLIDRALELGAKLSLTVTLAGGVNEDELGPILSRFFASDQILSVMVQPLAQTQAALRGEPYDPRRALTMPDVIRLLAAHSAGVLAQSDFTPLPCSHPTCFALTYLLKTEHNTLVPLSRLLNADDYLDMIKNQALINTDAETLFKVRDALYSLWSSDGIVPNQDKVLRTIRSLLLDLNKLDPGAPPRELLQLGIRHVKSIFIHQFMDRFTFDLTRAVKCCNHYPQLDGRFLPACIRNNITAHRKRLSRSAATPIDDE